MDEPVQTTNICPDCGNPVGIGLWPWCPHGTPTMIVDGTYYDHTLQTETTRGDRKRIMKERNLEYYAPKVGMPGCEV